MPNKEYLKCKRCGKTLKDSDSKRRGYGYICWQIHLLEEKKNMKGLFDFCTKEEK